MCLPIDSWFCCTPRTVNDDDYHHPAKQGPPPTLAPAGSRTRQLAPQPNGQRNGGYYNGNGYPVHHAPAAAEADHKASNDLGRGLASAQEKADGTLKQQPTAAARNGMVGAADGARGVAHNNYYEPAHREDAAVEFYHHHHQATTATADHERY